MADPIIALFADTFDNLILRANKLPPDQLAQPAPDQANGTFDELIRPPAMRPRMMMRVKDALTGEMRTEIPKAPEFERAAIETGHISAEDVAAGREPSFDGSVIGRSHVTSDPAAALDILSKQISGGQARKVHARVQRSLCVPQRPRGSAKRCWTLCAIRGADPSGDSQRGYSE